jgi:hypothetical protein
MNMKTFLCFSLMMFLAVSFISCGSKEEDMTPVQPGETEVFKDQVYMFSFKAPKNWVAESTPGDRTSYYSSQAAEIAFQKVSEGGYEGELGAKIEAGAKKGTTAEAALADYKANMEGLTFGNTEQTTLGGVPARKVTFTLGEDENAYMGYRIFTQKDSIVTYFEAASFGKKRMEKYKAIFELAETSVHPGYELNLKAGGVLDSATIATLKEEAQPSDRMSTYNGSGFTISYPDNFNIRAAGKSVTFEGDWKGALIRVDAIPSGGSDLTKFAEENSKKAYGGAAVTSATIGGQPAKVINYSTVAGVGSRAYFIMNGQTAYRITINWPKELEGAFKPAFEKSAASFQLK